jgi:hypothetical protein
MVPAYVAAACFLMIYGLVAAAGPAPEIGMLRVLFDPFGMVALTSISKYWTVSEFNSNLVPLERGLLLNRTLWCAVGAGVYWFTWARFKLVASPEGRKARRQRLDLEESEPLTVHALGDVPQATILDSLAFRVRQCLRLVAVEFGRVAFHPAFILITLLALLQMFMNFTYQDPWRPLKYPLTSTYLGLVGDMMVYMLPITIIFSGVLVWRERDHRINELFDTLPLPDWMSHLSKLLALMGIQALVVALIFAVGAATQVLYFGYTELDLGLYFVGLVGLDLIGYWQLAILFIFLQNISGSKYVGFFLCAFFVVAGILMPQYAKFDTSLLHYGQLPGYTYSNINGYGHFAEPLIWYRIYWLLLGAILVLISNLLWRRNNETRLKFRLRVAIQRLGGAYGASLALLFILFGATGGWIYYNNHILNPFITPEGQRKILAKYERQYKRFQDHPQPTIVHIGVEAELYPKERDALLKGRYTLKNKTTATIKDVHVNLAETMITKINRLGFSAESSAILTDRETGFHTFRLAEPLPPGGEIELQFDYEARTPGFSITNPKNELAANGTLILGIPFQSPDYFPQIGYNDFREIGHSGHRRELDLPEQVVPTLDDPPIKSTFLGGVITYEAIIGTSGDQIAVSNGRLVRQWSEGGRNYFHYRCDEGMNNAPVIHSGFYEVAREEHEGVKIEVYYNKKHPQNVARLIKGVKDTYDYCTKYFCPYPYGVLRVVESSNARPFGGSALSLPTNFVWSEDGGFIYNMEEWDKFDMLYATSCHEMAHQWWAHIVRPAEMEGMAILVETMANYIQTMVVSREAGKETTREYLKNEQITYLRMRSQEREEEMPMMREYNQTYLRYNKGSVVMAALVDYIGEENVNAALKKIVDRFGFQDAPYPTTRDLIAELRAVTPPHLQYLITDLLETITLHENKAESATATPLDDGRYQVTLTVSSKKLRADGVGNETPTPLEDLIAIGVFRDNGEELHLEKKRITDGKQTFEIVVGQRPAKAGIDPYGVLIDRNREDNLLEVEFPSDR